MADRYLESEPLAVNEAWERLESGLLQVGDFCPAEELGPSGQSVGYAPDRRAPGREV